MEELEPFLKGYPPPSPPVKQPDEIFHLRDYCNIDNRARQANPELVNDFDKLMTYLLEGTTSDLAKVRSIFVWLSNEVVITRVFPKVVRPNIPLEWLKKIKLDRSFYAELFTIMCRKAGVPCVIIEGSSKGAGFEVGNADEMKVTNRWNAVHVEGSWCLVNVSWALIITDGLAEGEWEKVEQDGVAVRTEEVSKKEVKQVLDELWFLISPENCAPFLHPKDPRWQLLEFPWSDKDFLDTPRFAQDYFHSEWELVTHSKGKLVAKNGTCKLGFMHPTEGIKSASLTYNLYFNPKQSPKPLPDELQLERYVLVDSKLGEKSLVFRLPQEGVYRVEVAGQLDDVLTPLGEFRIDCPAFKKEPAPFPEGCSEIGYTETAAALGLEDPSQEEGIVEAKPGERVEFGIKFAKDKFKPRDVRATVTHCIKPGERVEFGVKLAKDKLEPRPTDKLSERAEVVTKDDGFTVSVQMAKGGNIKEMGVCIDVLPDFPDGGDQSEEIDYINAINYIVTQDEELAFPEEKAIMKNNSDLLESIKNFDTVQFFTRYSKMKDSLDPVMRSKVEVFLKEVNKIKVKKLQELVQAMHGTDLNVLEKALSDYEELREVNLDSVKQARATLGLLRALKSEDSNAHTLEEALKAAYAAGLRTNSNSNVQRAEGVLVSMYAKELGGAYYKRNLETLGAALSAVSRSCVKDQVEREFMFDTAMKLQQHLKEMKQVTDQVGKLKSEDLKKIAGPSNSEPHPHVRSVLMATFILLGERESNLWDWKIIQNLLERRSEQGVARAMAAIDMDSLDIKRVSLAEGHVRTCQWEVLNAEDPNSALFLKWVNGIAEEKRGRDAVRHHHTQIKKSN